MSGLLSLEVKHNITNRLIVIRFAQDDGQKRTPRQDAGENTLGPMRESTAAGKKDGATHRDLRRRMELPRPALRFLWRVPAR
ncbi:MAG TPA: hypothetical protein VEI74_00835, partial [Candidatus Methylomirabilis sp.]|nr:hypothetical protein [Candidatus Methylomirabilis sp.]